MDTLKGMANRLVIDRANRLTFHYYSKNGKYTFYY